MLKESPAIKIRKLAVMEFLFDAFLIKKTGKKDFKFLP